MPAWLIVNVWPPIVGVRTRFGTPVLDPTATVTCPGAVPLAGDMVTPAADALDDQAHPVVGAEMEIVTEPPVAVRSTPAALRAKEHEAANCVTVNVWPPAVMVPERWLVVEFGAAE